MIAYVTVGTKDLPRAAKFYDSVFGQLGAKRSMESERFVAWSSGEGKPGVGVTLPFDEKNATVGNGGMVALACESLDQIKAVHSKALELGATDEGVPGPRGDAFFCGYFRDLDGNKFNLFCPQG